MSKSVPADQYTILERVDLRLLTKSAFNKNATFEHLDKESISFTINFYNEKNSISILICSLLTYLLIYS